MGNAISKSLSKIFGTKEMRLLMLGLDAAGKTSQPKYLLVPDAGGLLMVRTSDPLQAQTEPRCHYHTNCGLQC
jgi:hypothetical protein